MALPPLPGLNNSSQTLPILPGLETGGLPILPGLSGKTKKPDLTTVAGLLVNARQAGVEPQAQALIGRTGEDPEKIFSGGTIRDIFDALGIGQFAAAGAVRALQEGRPITRGIKEGIQKRASFTDVIRGGKLPTTPFSQTTPGEKEQRVIESTLGTVGDILLDPLNLLGVGLIGKGGKAAKFLEKANVASRGKNVTGGEVLLSAIKTPGISISKALEASVKPAAKFLEKAIRQPLGKAFVYRFGQDPVYAQLAEEASRKVAIGAEEAVELARPIIKLPKEIQQQIAMARKAGELERLPKPLLEAARPAFDELDRLGKEAVDLGLLDPQTYDANVGRYIARLYRTKELTQPTDFVKGLLEKKPVRVDLSRFKKRMDIPEDVREAMGEILEAGYPTGKALVQLRQAVERTKFFNQVSSKWGSNTVEEGMKQLPETKALGALSGKAVFEPIYDDIQELIRIKTPTEKLLGKVVGGFKFGKVILNPATHVRNTISNFILNDFEGLSPLRLDVYGKAAKEIAKKGEIFKEAKKAGLGVDTFAASELRDVITSEIQIGNKAAQLIKGAANKVADLYQKEELWAKMSQYIFQRSKGLSPDEAVKIAERATFNYAQVTPFIRKVRESLFGMPFITFTYKATPQIIRTAITQPGKVSQIGKIVRGVESVTTPDELKKERSVEPDYFKQGYFIKLPGKDKHGRSIYFDLTYLLPFGDFVTLGFLDRRVDRETGLPENVLETLGRNSPIVDTVLSLAKNKDFFGNAIYKQSDDPVKQSAAIFNFLAKQYLPPAAESPVGALVKEGRKPADFLPFRVGQALDFERQQSAGQEPDFPQTRTVNQELLRALLGLKQTPFIPKIQAKQRESEKRKRLQTLLQELGVIKEFSRPYIPKGQQ